MNDEISIFIIPVEILKVHLQFSRVHTSSDTGTLIQLTSKYLLCNTLPRENHGWKSRKQTLWQLQEEISGHPRGPRGERVVGYSVSLIPIAFLITASPVWHSGNNPLRLLALEFKGKDRSVCPLGMYIQGFWGYCFFVQSSSQVRSIQFRLFLLYLPDVSGSSEAWSKGYTTASVLSPTLIHHHLIRMEIPSEESNTWSQKAVPTMSERQISGFVLLGYYLDLKWRVPSVPLELFNLGHQLNLGWIGEYWKIFKLTL